MTEYEGVDEFYLKDDSNLVKESIPLTAPITLENEMEVVTSKVEVPGSFYANSSASDETKEDLGSEESF